jgi:hypothetical protein
MGPMEGANAEMDDARRDAGPVIGRAADAVWKPVEAGVRESQISPCAVWSLIFAFGLTHGSFVVNPSVNWYDQYTE